MTTPAWRGVNHNIYSQSTWAAGQPNAEGKEANYKQSDHRTIDYFASKGMNHIRLMFTMEWFQDTLSAIIPDTGNAARLAYWHAFVDTVNYATSLGMYVMIEHYGFSTIAGEEGTRPMWKNNLVGSAMFTNAHFVNLYTQLATYFSSNNLVGFGMLNEPNHMSTMDWFSAAQAVITAIRNTGSTAWIFVPGNGWSSWQWTSNSYDTASPKRSSAYGWENANGTGSPLSDPLNKLIAAPHIYMDDDGGKTYNINAVGGGTQANALVDRIRVVVDWARGFNTAHPTTPIKVYLGEIGYYAGTTNTGLGGNYTATTARTCWNNFITYLEANADVLVGFAWWAASDMCWWRDDRLTHFSVSPTTSGVNCDNRKVYSGDTINMNMIENTFF
jgi:endoglucanase